MRKKLIIITVLALCSAPLQAEKLSVVDTHGLTRAVKNISSTAKVEIGIDGKQGTVRLVQIDGVANEKSCQVSNNLCVITGVSFGKWKIVPDGKLKVTSVKISG